jgi:hypothetical protein
MIVNDELERIWEKSGRGLVLNYCANIWPEGLRKIIYNLNRGSRPLYQ